MHGDAPCAAFVTARCPLPARKCDREAAAAANATLDRNLAAHRIHRALDDSEAEARAAGIAAAGAVRSVEALEDVRQALRGDADAGVRDGEGDPVSPLLRRDERLPARQRVAERVLHEIGERLPQQRRCAASSNVATASISSTN
jgi:hypothetical protein